MFLLSLMWRASSFWKHKKRLVFRPSIHPSIHPSIQPSIQTSIQTSIHPSSSNTHSPAARILEVVIMLLKNDDCMMTFRTYSNDDIVGSPPAGLSRTFFHAYSFLLKDMVSICVFLFQWMCFWRQHSGLLFFPHQHISQCSVSVNVGEDRWALTWRPV